MKLNIKLMAFALFFLTASGCNKEKFLDKKSNSNIVVPQSLEELTALLDMPIINLTSDLPILSSDEYYYTSKKDLDRIQYPYYARNAYTWAKDLFAGETLDKEWFFSYQSVLYANVVLEQFVKLPLPEQNAKSGKDVKARALFIRAFNFYDLLRNYAPCWDETTAAKNLGIPIRLSANINKIEQRASVKESYERVFKDLNEAASLFSDEFPSLNRNRASKAAVYALLARIYLDMRYYSQAEESVNSALKLYNQLLDYNTLDLTSDQPFDLYNKEVILNSIAIGFSNQTRTGRSSPLIDPFILDSYDANDLRKNAFYGYRSGRFYLKHNYGGDKGGESSSSPAFSGLAVDELYLIKAECLARKGDADAAMKVLNTLLKTRWVTGTFKDFMASSAEDALAKILMERRKELVWRGVRWFDVKRLNKEGANITLIHKAGDEIYTLPPNDPRSVFPIPDNEITGSGLIQNIR